MTDDDKRHRRWSAWSFNREPPPQAPPPPLPVVTVDAAEAFEVMAMLSTRPPHVSPFHVDLAAAAIARELGIMGYEVDRKSALWSAACAAITSVGVVIDYE